MKPFMRLPSFFLAGMTLLATAATAQINDGKPDHAIEVPERLDLPYALAYALDNNFTIRQAKERIRQQEGVVLEVKATRIPTLSASGAYQRQDTEIASNGEDNYWTFGISARQTIYAGGGITASNASQKLTLDASVLALQEIVNDVLLDVRTKFYSVLVARERIKVQEQNVELLQRQLQDVKNRFEAGTVSNFEVLRAEVALANAQPALITARNDYRLGIEQLRLALGFTNTSEASLAKVPDFIGSLDFQPASFELRSALTTAREQRPDLQRLGKLEQAAQQGVIVRRANYQPALALFADYDWNKRTGTSSISKARDGWTAGVSASWNIFDGRATAGRVVQAKSILEQAKLAYAEAQLSVDVEVRRAISSFQQANELAEASKKVVEQAEEAVRLADARYAAGTATQLDVLQARTDLTTARLNQLQAFYSYNVAVATVRNAMGLPDELKPAGELTWPQP